MIVKLRTLFANLKQNFADNQVEIVLFSLILLAGILFRWFLIENGNILFWYDQARDAIVSQEIINNLDLKIQGPSASGTNDSVHHGVLYYYLIAPLYAIFKGNPIMVSFSLGLLSLLTIWPITWLTWRFTKSKIMALAAATLYALSVESSQTGTWLSNPMISIISIPFFFFFLWRVFWDKKFNELPWLALALGISHQSAIYSIFLFGSLIATSFYFWGKNNLSVLTNKKVVLVSLFVYLTTVSTMILNQVLLMYHGIFNPLKIAGGLNNDFISPSRLITMIYELYIGNLTWSLFPTKPMLSIIFFICLLVILWKKVTIEQRVFLIIWLSAPLWLMTFQVRNSYHTLMGIAPALIILIVTLINEIKINKQKYLVLGFLFLVFTVSNFQQMIISRNTSQHVVAIQTGTGIKDKLELIDYTYQIADGQPFSISSFSSPYLYNTTWSYLYSWYGQREYGYLPQFWGASQVGMPGENLLEPTMSPAKIHFALFEPDNGIPLNLRDTFILDQNAFTLLMESKNFGSMLAQYRQPKPPELIISDQAQISAEINK